MKSINVTIVDPIGIHARPASMISSAAAKFQSSVTFKNGDKVANAKSVINLMALSAKQGNAIEITVDGSDEEEAIAAIKKVMEEEKLI